MARSSVCCWREEAEEVTVDAPSGDRVADGLKAAKITAVRPGRRRAEGGGRTGGRGRAVSGRTVRRMARRTVAVNARDDQP
ncbi:hypothetical protein GCM10010353_51790 [Streptomyces chryseus]|uniref:Uncharacterized protein n=1 Tax=Streptomyces chryseus TaxID=68186 RepID=A0ABQ3E550_9ACTN|nr:hypothetical protein GCM10010353_51790 [Streptomyces chryseus]GHB23761.1 hypothetical protein GCM10010346_54400 [Streptomyces chryseus]